MRQLPAFLFACLVGTVPLHAAAIQFSKPVDCIMGEECYVQNYIDQQPGLDSQDFQCGTLSYNEQNSIDIRTRDYSKLNEGIKVIAAADGMVIGVRNGLSDYPLKNREKLDDKTQQLIASKPCGNGVIIDHGEGWQTQYCHLRRNSIPVKNGQKVKAGAVLGVIGKSGHTTFPHTSVHFKKDGLTVDPYTGTNIETGCVEPKNAKGLWTDKASNEMAYRETALLGFGLSVEVPNETGARYGNYRIRKMDYDDGPIHTWVDILGVKRDDILAVRIYGHEGSLLVNNEKVFEKNHSVVFQYFGSKMPTAGWPPGNYRIEYLLIRTGKNGLTTSVIKEERKLEVIQVKESDKLKLKAKEKKK